MDMRTTTYRWCFTRPDGWGVWFGPYETCDEARAAFQRRYGTWPVDYIGREMYDLTARI